MYPCEQDALLLLLSDGVHDNLDPEVLRMDLVIWR